MKNGKLHLIIGTTICLATMAAFLVLGDRLPNDVPVQLNLSGEYNTLPKPFVTFGLPLICATGNIIMYFKNDDGRIWKYYVIPTVAIALTIFMFVV